MQADRCFGHAVRTQAIEITFDAIWCQVRERVGLRVKERARAPDDDSILPERAFTDGFLLALEPVRKPRGRRLLPQGVVDAPRFASRLTAGFLVQRGQHTPARQFDEVPRLVGADPGRLPIENALPAFPIPDKQIYIAAFRVGMNVDRTAGSGVICACRKECGKTGRRVACSGRGRRGRRAFMGWISPVGVSSFQFLLCEKAFSFFELENSISKCDLEIKTRKIILSSAKE